MGKNKGMLMALVFVALGIGSCSYQYARAYWQAWAECGDGIVASDTLGMPVCVHSPAVAVPGRR